MKRWPILMVCVLACANVHASEPEYLLRADRRTADDVEELLAAGIPVVMETNSTIFMMGEDSHLRWLRDRGVEASVLDRYPARWDYLLVGLRPDSDADSVHRLGLALWEAENWVLIRVPRGFDRRELHAARVFVTKLPHETMQPARSAGGPRVFKALTDSDPPDPLVQKIVGLVDTTEIDRFWTDLTDNPPTGTRYTESQGCRDASEYCLNTYSALGVAAEYQEYRPDYAPNVVATHEGAVAPDEVYLVIGHLDDLPSTGPAPGADDNASGSVNVLESARAMTCYPYKKTIKFLNVTGEETGLHGSTAYANDAQARGENILGVINMDMPGWEGDGAPDPEDLDLDYNSPSQWLAQAFADAADRYGTGLVVDPIYCPSLSASDHWPFWQRGWSAVLGITDNEGYCGHGGYYPHYHTSDDTIANCGDPSFFYSVVRTSVATAAELAEPFKITFHDPAYACAGTVRISVGDRDLNSDPMAQEQVQVQVWSSTEPGGEPVTLAEKSVDSMIFFGTIPTTQQPPSSGDGLLSVSPGDAISAEYLDALDCDGASNVTYTATASVDCDAPAISQVGHRDVTDTEATIEWLTDEPADGEVGWGESTPPESSTAGERGVTSHHVELTGLQPCTVYYYEARATDLAGNPAVNDNEGLYYHFETLDDFGNGLQSCHAGQTRLLEEVIACGGALEVEVTDIDLNLSSTEAETVEVSVTSTTEPDPEALTLVETGPNTSKFRGGISTEGGDAVRGDGVLQVAHDDALTATYHDEDDGTGHGAVSFETGRADCEAAAFDSVTIAGLTDESAEVHVTTSDPTTVTVDWGSAPDLLDRTVSDDALDTGHQLLLAPLDECGRFYFRVTATDAYGNAAIFDANGEPLEFNAHEIPGAVYKEGFEAATGWTLEGEWEIGPPQGLGSSPGDPVDAYSGAESLGHDLSGQGSYPGDYEPNRTERAISPVIDASTLSNGEMVFRRWLNVGGGAIASIEVQTSGGWTTVWNSDSISGVTESSWGLERVDISALADGASSLQVAFKQRGGFMSSAHRAGWNVDRLIVRDATLPDFDACGSCAGAPSFAGVRSAQDAEPCADSGITLSWAEASAWGTGHAGSYSVHRDTSPSFVPSPANRIATGVTGTSWTDGEAPNDVDLYYIVRAENDETCSTGPSNGGVQDDNVVVATARDETGQPAPGDVGETLRVRPVNAAHVRLSWDPTPGAASYRVYRSDSPDGPFGAIGDVTDAFYEDEDEMDDPSTHYYDVKALDACGNLGP